MVPAVAQEERSVRPTQSLGRQKRRYRSLGSMNFVEGGPHPLTSYVGGLTQTNSETQNTTYVTYTGPQKGSTAHTKDHWENGMDTPSIGSKVKHVITPVRFDLQNHI